MYKDYLECSTASKMVETDFWFFVYRIVDGYFEIRDMYIPKKFRSAVTFQSLKHNVFTTAKESGCKIMKSKVYYANPKWRALLWLYIKIHHFNLGLKTQSYQMIWKIIEEH